MGGGGGGGVGWGGGAVRRLSYLLRFTYRFIGCSSSNVHTDASFYGTSCLLGDRFESKPLIYLTGTNFDIL